MPVRPGELRELASDRRPRREATLGSLGPGLEPDAGSRPPVAGLVAREHAFIEDAVEHRGHLLPADDREDRRLGDPVEQRELALLDLEVDPERGAGQPGTEQKIAGHRRRPDRSDEAPLLRVGEDGEHGLERGVVVDPVHEAAIQVLDPEPGHRSGELRSDRFDRPVTTGTSNLGADLDTGPSAEDLAQGLLARSVGVRRRRVEPGDADVERLFHYAPRATVGVGTGTDQHATEPEGVDGAGVGRHLASASMRPAVVDVDSHFQEPISWLADVDPILARSLPGSVLVDGMAAFAGQSSRALPARPFWDALERWGRTSTLADAPALAEDPATQSMFGTTAFDPANRLRWLDQAGIDHQFCHPTLGAIMWSGAGVVDGARRQVARSYNRWAVAASSSSSGRLHASMLIDTSDLDWSCRELEWAAAHGCCTVLLPIDVDLWTRLSTEEAAVGFWEVLDATGIAAVLHVGVVGRNVRRTTVVGHWADVPLQAQRCLARWATASIATGRRTRILVQELGVDWAAPWRRNLERAVATPVVEYLAGEAELSLGDALDRIVWSVLPRDVTSGVVGSDEPITLAFGSDHPHREGWGGDDPVGSFRACVGEGALVATWPDLVPVVATDHVTVTAPSHSSG